MHDDPTVTVLMPVRNASPWLSEALASLLAQTYTDFEIVTVDDGSIDDSGRILAAHAEHDPRIRVFSTRGGDGGLVAALNLGLARARGRYVARMDADDVALPDRLNAQVELLRTDDSLAAATCQVEGFPPAGLGAGMERYLDWQNALIRPAEIRRDRFVESPLVAPSLLIRLDVLRDVLGGWQDRGWPEDWDLVLRLFESGQAIARVPRVLHRWRQHASQATLTDTRYIPDALLGARAHYLARHLRSTAGSRAIWLLGAGPVGKALVEALVETGIVVAGFAEVDPGKIGNHVRRAGHTWPVVAAETIVDERVTCYAVSAVGRVTSREKIRAWLTGHGWREELDFVVAA